MVHPYLRRREGLETVEYPDAGTAPVLEKTLGVPLFQEQAMQVAIVCAGFTPGEADGSGEHGDLQVHRWRLAFSRQDDRRHGRTATPGVRRADLPVEGFGSYGFPESSRRQFRADRLCLGLAEMPPSRRVLCALLNAQPMGFYAPAQIVRDAQAHGVEVRPVCVNASRWDCTLEPTE